jgi:TRAP-type C4-dicarboxylate transport system permease small subunit
VRQIAEFIAVLACSLFTGAAVYLSWLNTRRVWNAARN